MKNAYLNSYRDINFDNWLSSQMPKNWFCTKIMGPACTVIILNWPKPKEFAKKSR